jgi:hypothetical protein
MSNFIRVTGVDDEKILLNPAAIAISRDKRWDVVEIVFRNPDQKNMHVKEKLEWIEDAINGVRGFNSD